MAPFGVANQISIESIFSQCRSSKLLTDLFELLPFIVHQPRSKLNLSNTESKTQKVRNKEIHYDHRQTLTRPRPGKFWLVG